MDTKTLGLFFIHMVTLSYLVKDEKSHVALMGTFKEISNSWSHMFGTQIPSIQGFCASDFHICRWNLGMRVEKLSF